MASSKSQNDEEKEEHRSKLSKQEKEELSSSRRRRRKREKSKSRKKRRSDSNRKSRKGRSDSDRHRSRKRRRRRRSRSSSSSNSESDSDDDNSSSSSGDSSAQVSRKKVTNQKLLKKLAARGETLEEREERRAQRRAARIASQFGYTAEENPFNDPNLADTFTWNKKEELDKKKVKSTNDNTSRMDKQEKIISEIHKVRNRRREYEEYREELERMRAEESKMKELENYDDWAKKEEEFHLQQQRQRSAIRLVEGREKPVDVLAKNLLLFGLTEEEKKNRAAIKYKERYNALEELETLEAELEEPHLFLQDLKLAELEELLVDVEAFKTLEREAEIGGGAGSVDVNHPKNAVLRYWDALHLVTNAEIDHLKSNGGEDRKEDSKSLVNKEIQKMFQGQTIDALLNMKSDVETKLKRFATGGKRSLYDEHDGGLIDSQYWQTVLNQLRVHLAKNELSDLHSKMLVCQLEKLELRKEELGKVSDHDHQQLEVGKGTLADGKELDIGANGEGPKAIVPKGIDPDFGNLEEELGLSSQVDLGPTSFAWQEKYRPRKPRYFNRVKTGYDWNKYNQTHYDHDNPPPKTVQGYKFNIFYPDLIDKMKTPDFILEPTDQNEFCIIRFRAGPPYEDVAFKIINRQWNRSRKRGFRCVFERGVLTLYFNFASHWFRR